MRMKIKRIYLLNIVVMTGLLILSTACLKTEDTGFYEGNINLFNNSETYQEAITARKSGIGSSRSDPFEIEAVLRDGDSLKVDVAYSGGCAEHNFNVIWDGTILASSPCQINLIIAHDAQNDNCEAYIRETLIIDLNQLVGDNDEKDTCIYNVFSMLNESDVPDEVAITYE